MISLRLDKIASVTLNCGLRHDVKLSKSLRCQTGDVVAVRLLNDKPKYNELELTTGRMSRLQAGDVLAGALGHRNASQGYSGHVPASLEVGESIQLLNLGGVLGVCTSASSSVGAPFECEVLGQVLSFPVLGSRQGRAANIGDQALPLVDQLPADCPPVLVIVGTNMNSGKTEACLSIIQRLARLGLRVGAGKATGVSLRRDVLAMEDAGASEISIFTDFGVVTSSRETAACSARSIVAQLSKAKPDVIVLELGDGLLGTYGVDSILHDPSFRSAARCFVLAAGDPVGAWGGVKLLADYQILPTVITGPATDNSAGVSAIETSTGVSAINARNSGDELVDVSLKALKWGGKR